MMILLRICSIGLYAKQYESFVHKNITDSVSYEEAMKSMWRGGMLYPSGFCRQMNALGIEAHDIVPDFPFLQTLWKNQYGLHNGEDIVIAQIQHYRPDVIYFQELDVMSHAFRKSLKSQFPFVKIITGFKGFPPRMFSDYTDLDHIFISYPYFQKAWQDIGVPVTILPHCFDPGSNVSTEETPKQHNFTFVGSTGFGNLAQEGRYNDLRELLTQTPLEVWGKERSINKTYLITKGLALSISHLLPRNALYYIRSLLSSRFTKLDLFLRDSLLVKDKLIQAFDWYIFKPPLKKLFPKKFHDPVVGQEYLSVLSASKISFNRHTDEKWEGGNIRTFEATGSGACLLTDDRDNLNALFRDDEIVRYVSIEDAVDKITYLLAHPDETARIAARGRIRTLRDHTTQNRCKTVASVLQQIRA